MILEFFVIFCGFEFSSGESKVNTFAEADQSSFSGAVMMNVHRELVFESAFWHLLRQSQLTQQRPALCHSHRLVKHVDPLVQLQHWSSYTRAKCSLSGERF